MPSSSAALPLETLPRRTRSKTNAAVALYRAMDLTFWLPQAEAALAQVGGGTMRQG
jgi:hypothetical protein